jgi:pimeloyl-ACP methyl ester carboxylesterase
MSDSSLPDGWTEGDVETNGARLHYYRSGGGGRPFVVAHGITSDGRSRIPLVEALADEYDVVTYDARGHGRSSGPETGWDYPTLATDLAGLVEALDLTDPVLYGHSMGGTTVALAAATHSDLPHAVVMEDPELLLRLDDEDDEEGADENTADDPDSDGTDDAEVDPGWAMMLERIHGTPADSPEALLERDPELVELVDEGREEIATLLAHAYLNVDANVGGVLESDGPDHADVFPDIVAPTLVLRADVGADARELNREAVSFLPDGELVHVDGAGHCVLRDRHEQAFGTLRDFLDEHP